MTEKKDPKFPYLHGFTDEEQERLWKQAEFSEHLIYHNVDFSEQSQLLEVGCGVGAQTSILLRRYPHLTVTSIDASSAQLDACKKNLEKIPYTRGRFQLKQMSATDLSLPTGQYDGAFICWVLEHLKDPGRALSELRRVLRPGAKVVITEVMNSSFFLEPYSPNVWRYWMAFNDFQYDNAGDPFIGAKLGNLLLNQGYKDINTEVKIWHYDNRSPQKRRNALRDWKEVLYSASESLIKANYVGEETVAKMEDEFKLAESDPNAVFFDAFVQATATV